MTTPPETLAAAVTTTIETASARFTELSGEVEAVGSAFDLANPKPQRDVYLDVMSSLRVTPDHCVAVEDSWTAGVQASLRAGLGTVWLTTEPVDSLKDKVAGPFASDAECRGDQRPEIVFVTELDADVVEKFSEA